MVDWDNIEWDHVPPPIVEVDHIPQDFGQMYRDAVFDPRNTGSQMWQIEMLNDSERNQKYFQALKQTKAENQSFSSVLDIGSGTGLLSFYANKVILGYGLCMLQKAKL